MPRVAKHDGMRSDGIVKHLALTFVIALVFYIASFAWIEHRRTFRGPWEITFVSDASGHPSLAIAQPALNITQSIDFAGQKIAATSMSQKQTFAEAVKEIPFGEMIFQDPTFLPGTVTMKQFGHEIELLPRVLIIDKKEIPWGGQAIELR
jgi:hypothetical protein